VKRLGRQRATHAPQAIQESDSHLEGFLERNFQDAQNCQNRLNFSFFRTPRKRSMEALWKSFLTNLSRPSPGVIDRKCSSSPVAGTVPMTVFETQPPRETRPAMGRVKNRRL
jgi:hypothetical protein